LTDVTPRRIASGTPFVNASAFTVSYLQLTSGLLVIRPESRGKRQWCFQLMGCSVPLAIYASDTRRLVWFLRSRGAFFGVGDQGGETWVAVQCREIGIFLKLEGNVGSQSVVDCLSQKG
jgi:hypothetical protein